MKWRWSYHSKNKIKKRKEMQMVIQIQRGVVKMMALGKSLSKLLTVANARPTNWSPVTQGGGACTMRTLLQRDVKPFHLEHKYGRLNNINQS